MRLLKTAHDFAQRYPISAAAIAAGLKGVSADQCVQRFVEKRAGPSIDWRRTFFFANFGWLYVGVGQYAIFNGAFPLALRSVDFATGRLRRAAAMTFLDSCVHLPFVYLPLFYCAREAFTNEASAWKESIKKGVNTWRTNLLHDCTLQAAIFVPIQGFNFYFNPAHLRVPFIVAAGYIWMIVLSVCRGEEGLNSLENEVDEK